MNGATDLEVSPVLRVGGVVVVVDRAAALEFARGYLTVGNQWAYPAYDGYDAEHAHGPLVDAELHEQQFSSSARLRVHSLTTCTPSDRAAGWGHLRRDQPGAG